MSEEWEPGDPLYSPSGYSNYFFNFRSIEDEDEMCRCPDRARWPDPDVWGQRLKSEEWFIEYFKRELEITDG